MFKSSQLPGSSEELFIAVPPDMRRLQCHSQNLQPISQETGVSGRSGQAQRCGTGAEPQNTTVQRTVASGAVKIPTGFHDHVCKSGTPATARF